MPAIIFGVLVLVLLLVALNAFSRVDPHKLAAGVKMTGGIGALGVAGLLASRGQFGLAIPLGLAGLGLLGWLPAGRAGFFQRAQKTPGQISRVRSRFLEMELEHDSGAMRGRVLAGSYEGRSLDELDVGTLTGFLAAFDQESRALLMAYLDRRQPSWRDDVQADPAAGEAGPSRDGGKMSDQEAYEVLGLQPGASTDEIGRAYRTLMKKLHPDQGGSTYLAARVNQAKDLLLRRHR